MNDQFIPWVLGVVGTLTAGGIAAGIAAHIGIVQRLTKLETTLELIGRKAAKVLHSPDDHHGLDKYLDRYINNHHEMSLEEWLELKIEVECIEHDEKLSKQERALAAIIAAVCNHKLATTRYKLQEEHEGVGV